MEPFEPPKYITKLIAAINNGAKTAQLGTLALVAIGVFLLATTFSATDEDLLLNHAVSISQLGSTQIPIAFAFGLAPAVFVAVHLYTLICYDMLAENLQHFRGELLAMVPLKADQERCRHLLANVEFVNAIAVPRDSPSASWLFRAAAMMVLAVFPVLVLAAQI